MRLCMYMCASICLTWNGILRYSKMSPRLTKVHRCTRGQTLPKPEGELNEAAQDRSEVWVNVQVVPLLTPPPSIFWRHTIHDTRRLGRFSSRHTHTNNPTDKPIHGYCVISTEFRFTTDSVPLDLRRIQMANAKSFSDRIARHRIVHDTQQHGRMHIGNLQRRCPVMDVLVCCISDVYAVYKYIWLWLNSINYCLVGCYQTVVLWVR